MTAVNTFLWQHPRITLQQAGNRLQAVKKHNPSATLLSEPTAQQLCLSFTRRSALELPRWLGSNLLQALPAGISLLTSLKQL
jgi:hypothetical protein